MCLQRGELIPPIIKITTLFGLNNAPAGVAGSPHACEVSRGGGKTKQVEDREVEGVGEGEGSAAEEEDRPSAENVETAFWERSTTSAKKNGVGTSSGDLESSEDSKDYSLDSNESKEEVKVVAEQSDEVRRVGRAWKRN